MLRTLLAAAAAGLISLTAQAQTPTADPPRNDYSDPANWLCLPGRADPCAADNTTTVIAADGAMTRETWAADPKAPIDCFYVYPTVSNDPGVISDMIPGPEEKSVVTSQLNRLGARCRIFAPLYRQFTLTALRAAVVGGPNAAAGGPRPNTGYLDVVDAWNWYLAHENRGRGVVLVGHSQGSGVLTQLIAKEIDGKPAQKLLVSAILGGTPLPVDKGKDTGTFKSIPTCKSAGQVGCVIAWASFRDTIPPPANTRFGRPRDGDPTKEAVCTNPAALAGGAAPLHAYLSTTANGQDPSAWVKGGPKVETPFVSLPGLLTGACVSKNGANYLEVHVNADPADPRTDDIRGDVQFGKQVAAEWGLHLIDMNLVMGDLVAVVGAQTRTWLKR